MWGIWIFLNNCVDIQWWTINPCHYITTYWHKRLHDRLKVLLQSARVNFQAVRQERHVVYQNISNKSAVNTKQEVRHNHFSNDHSKLLRASTALLDVCCVVCLTIFLSSYVWAAESDSCSSVLFFFRRCQSLQDLHELKIRRHGFHLRNRPEMLLTGLLANHHLHVTWRVGYI